MGHNLCPLEICLQRCTGNFGLCRGKHQWLYNCMFLFIILQGFIKSLTYFLRRGYETSSFMYRKEVMIVVRCLGAILLFSLLFSIAAQAADEVVGYVKTTKGDATIVRGKSIIPARINEKISIHDVLKTGAKSSLGVVLKDDTLIALGSNSEVSIREFNFSPGEGKLSLFIRLLKGCALFSSGIIGKLSPGTVKFATPVGDIGLRGTRFLVSLAEE